APLPRVGGEIRPFQFANHTGFQRVGVGPMRELVDVGGAPALKYAERAHARALAFELSSGTGRLLGNIGATRELSPAARMRARAATDRSTPLPAAQRARNVRERRARWRLSGPQQE